MNSEVARAFVSRSRHQIDHARSRINHCFDQLLNEDVWWTPRDGSNSIGIIIQHLLGNLRQWAVAGIGGEADVRDRPSEFRMANPLPKAELQADLNRMLDQTDNTYSAVANDELLDPRRIQGWETTVLDAIYDTMCHLQLHTGQVLYVTRLRLGDAYRESWSPATPEQGA